MLGYIIPASLVSVLGAAITTLSGGDAMSAFIVYWLCGSLTMSAAFARILLQQEI